MSRAWDELVAKLFDLISPQLVLLVLIVGSAGAAALWYWYPAWLPRRIPRWRWRLRLPRRRPRARTGRRGGPARGGPAEPAPAPAAVPAPGTGSLADRLAAEGRYAEAIRERLRDTVGALSDAGVVHPEPGETAAEVAAAASRRRPAVAAPLGGATDLFSEVWYGDRPAGVAQDEHMRTLSGQVRDRLQDGGDR